MGQGTKNRTGRGTRDGGRNWEGEAPAEPKTAANGDWQLATGKTAASSEWRVASCRKIFCASGDAPSSFSACFSRLRFCSTEFSRVDEMGGRGSCRAETAASSEWRVANSFFWRAALLRCRKIFCASGDAPSSFSDCFSRLRFCRHRLQSVDELDKC
jgi:hypothetical protein